MSNTKSGMYAVLPLYFVLFLAMAGFGLTVPALPYFVERLAAGGRASAEAVAWHTGALTSAYAFGQLVSAPLWGRWSDRHGRRLPLMLGLAGFAAAQAAFGLSTALPALYAARLFGGLSAAALLTAGQAAVADRLPEGERGRGMAGVAAAVSLGFVAGPAMSGLVTRRDWHVDVPVGHLALDGFSLPFLVAAILAIAALPVVALGLRREMRTDGAARVEQKWGGLGHRLGGLLVLGFVIQGVLALFEAVFALYAGRVLDLSMSEVGVAFAVCGLVMVVVQVGLLAWTGGAHVGPRLIAGFALLGAGLLVLQGARSLPAVVGAVGMLALGPALVVPVLLGLAADRSGGSHGAALGLQSTAGSLGQVAGPVLGVLLFSVAPELPFRVSAFLTLAFAAVLALRGMMRRKPPMAPPEMPG